MDTLFLNKNWANDQIRECAAGKWSNNTYYRIENIIQHKWGPINNIKRNDERGFGRKIFPLATKGYSFSNL